MSDVESFLDLCARAADCRMCPRMDGRRRVLSMANGALAADIIFVAEAPGRLGGDRTGTPLTSDQTGRNFNRLLADAKISRDRVFITNAVLCNPRDERGNNAPPSQREVAACRVHLRETLAVVRAPLVVALGRAALATLDAIEPHGLQLRRDVGRPVQWSGRTLVPLYHPGPRAQLHRPFDAQRHDFLELARLVPGLVSTQK